MPVSPRTAGVSAPPCPQPAPAPSAGLRTPQARVLGALMPARPDDPPAEWPAYTRAVLARRAGYTAISGTLNRALKGIPRTCKTGEAHLGLLGLGYVVEEEVDVEGVIEVNYRATPAGVAAYRAHIAANGELPPLRDASLCVNNRYVKGTENRLDIPTLTD